MKKLGTRFPQAKFGLLTLAAAFVIAFVLIVPFIVYGGGIFWYYGDFNAQEIPFYQMLHSCVRNGNLGWNYLTDLGSDTVSSYSFYLLGSPFFWLTIPFPNWLVPYLIGPILIIKLTLCALSAYVYLKRYVKNGLSAVLGSLLYAFSGFSVYNIFFFHFHEAMIIFPLMLAALDAFLYERRRGIFAVTVFAACVINYYFFAGQAVFLVIYFLMLAFTKTWKFRWTEFVFLAIEAIIGCAAAAFIAVPTVFGIIANPRVSEVRDGWDMMMNREKQRYVLVLTAFFFPADMPAYPVFTPDLNGKWSSAAAWLPLFGMTGVIAYLQTRKRDWLKKLLTLLFLFSAVPVLNSSFQLFNNSIQYSRWFYMLTLMMILATLRACEDEENEINWKRAAAWSAGITAAIALIIGLVPNFGDEDDSRMLKLGVFGKPAHAWAYACISLACILIFVLIYKKYYSRNRRRFLAAATIAAVAVIVPASILPIGFGATVSSSTKPYKNVLNSRDKVGIDDLEDVRMDVYDSYDNIGMYWQVPSINCFQSTVSPSIMDFYEKIGYKRTVASRPDFSMYGIRALLSVKYYFDYAGDNDNPKTDKCFKDEDGKTKMPDWKFLKTNCGFDIYENENYLPMGFCFDSFVTEEEFERVNETHRSEALLYTMVLSREDMKKYRDITGYTDIFYSKLYGDEPDSFKSKVDDYSYGTTAYRKACKKLRAHSCESFEYTNSGFKAVYDNKGDDNLLFFSVAYSDGFTAKVNGVPAEVIKADYGLMAVRVPGHKTVNVEFEYETPGLKTGITISLCALGAFAVYLAAAIAFKRISKRKNAR